MKNFRLVRYFLAVTFIATPIVTGAAALLTAARFRAELLDEAKIYATEVAENVYNQVDRRFLAREGSLELDFSKDVVALARMEAIVGLAVYRHRVRQIYIFRPDGTTFFSTVREHIGRPMPPGNVHFQEALAGRVSSAVRASVSPPDISATPRGVELLETYVPIFSSVPAGGEKRLVAVVEVYQDMGELRAAMARVTTWTAFVALLSMTVLGGLFAVITVKADRVIRQRESDILASNSALHRLSNDLERQVRERTRQLIQKEKLASVGTLAAGVAHEINNPLATIAACAEGSLNRLAGEVPERALGEARAYLELIGDEVYRMKRITQNLLDFSRQEPSAVSAPIDLDQLVVQTVDLVRLGEGARDVPIDLDLGAEDDGLHGDPVQIRQVVHNLLSNSLTAVKGVERPRILMRTRSTPAEVWLECIDNGPGIPAGVRDKVFEPFFTTKPTGEGTGLGLAVSYSIAEQHGGALEIVEERADLEPAWRGAAGARMRLRLPRILAGHAAISGAAPAP
jgi:signal transduction histidine kinase